MTGQNGTLEVKNITVTFERWGQTVKALENVSFSVSPGHWVMLVGHNGSGKTTLLRTISGRLRPSTGEIKINGDRIDSLSPARLAERVFHVHQDPLLGTAPTLTLFENLFVADVNAQNGGVSRKELLEKYHELLKPLGLANRLKQLARYLSGGERQLLALTVARLRPSSIMLLDEPLAALDPAKTHLCLQQIKTLNDEGKTIIQVTHDPNLALSGGHRTVVLREGRIVYDVTGAKREVAPLREAWNQNVSGGLVQ